ncbi:MAG: ADOP family duplicated permease [Gemmatimonadetes bacterium]|nr:ADOP family duplicated permease [Gemmatimonadota bacterium]
MSPQAGLPRPLVWLLGRVLPRGRREDILGDLEASLREREARLGRGPARRHLWRELGALLVWRLSGGARPSPAPSTGAGEIGRATADHPQIPSGRGGRRGRWGRDVLQDMRFAVRTLARKPGFALTAVLVLALGIGAPTTVLTLVNRIFFWHPSDVAQPDRLVRIWRSWAPGQGGGSLGNPDYEYYRDHVSTLSGLAAWGGARSVVLSTDAAAVGQVRTGFVSDNYFHVLGTSMALGRGFVPDENRDPGTHPVAVLSYGLWRRAFGAEPRILGRTVLLNGRRFTVVGVAPEGFSGLSPTERAPDLWLPLAMFGTLARLPTESWWTRMPHNRMSWLSVVGRLAPGVTFQAAQANLSALSDANAYEGKPEGEGVLVSRQYLYNPSFAASLTALSRMLLGAVALVLLIAVANVAVLLLSRATTRSREMGIRVAVGAGRGRLVRQLLAESLVLALAGGAAGVACAYALSNAAGSLLPYSFVDTFTPEPRVLLAALVLTLLTALLAGLVPAVHVARSDVAASVDGTRVVGGRGRGRDVLVVGQVALSLVLVAGAMLFARSFWSARTQDIGFRTDHTLALGVDLRTRGYSTDEALAFIPRALQRLRALPGVTAAATTEMIPFQGDWSNDVTPPPGAATPAGDSTVVVGRNTVAAGYFRLMGIPVVRGRALGPEDAAGTAPAVVVNQTLARLFWPGQDPVGKTLDGIGDTGYTVVGVVRDATYYELGEQPATQAYTSVLQVYQPDVHFLVRTSGPAADVAPAAEAALREIDPTLAFGSVTTLASVFDEVTARYRVSAVLVGLFGALALLLAAAGLYGVVSFFVTRRTREIGVRMALGAGRGRVAAGVLGLGLRLAAVGVALGLAGALLLRRLVATLLYGVRPGDPWALAGACLVLLAVTALASLSPARRATRIDPMDAIRTD